MLTIACSWWHLTYFRLIFVSKYEENWRHIKKVKNYHRSEEAHYGTKSLNKSPQFVKMNLLFSGQQQWPLWGAKLTKLPDTRGDKRQHENKIVCCVIQALKIGQRGHHGTFLLTMKTPTPMIPITHNAVKVFCYCFAQVLDVEIAYVYLKQYTSIPFKPWFSCTLQGQKPPV